MKDKTCETCKHFDMDFITEDGDWVEYRCYYCGKTNMDLSPSDAACELYEEKN